MNEEQTQKTTLKKKRFTKTQTRGIYHKECKINLTENNLRTKKKQQKIMGKKNPRIQKTKNTHQFLQLHLSLIYLHCVCNKLNPKSVLMECLFFSPQFCLCNIYLFTFVFKICLFILAPVMCNLFPKRANDIFEIEQRKIS